MSSPELLALKEHFEEMPVDGWVEQDDVTGLLSVQLFASAIAALKLRRGQFVRIQVYDEYTQKRLGHDGQI